MKGQRSPGSAGHLDSKRQWPTWGQDGAQEGEAFTGEQGRTVAARCLDVPAFPLLENWRQED